jgi:hypothetical protein
MNSDDSFPYAFWQSVFPRPMREDPKPLVQSRCNYGNIQSVTANTSIAIFNRAIELDDEPFSPDTAKHILRWGFTAADQSRVADLMAKLKDQTISPDEREELEEFNRVNHLLAVLKSKARVAIRAAHD